MKNLDKKKIVIVGGLLLALVLVGTTYAFYSATVKNVEQTETNLIANKLSLIFESTKEVNITDIIPGDTVEKKFTVENKSNRAVDFNIFMENIINEFDEELTYTIKDDKGNVVISETTAPKTSTDREYLKEGVLIESGVKTTYTVIFKFIYKDTPQNDYQGSKFKGTLGIDTGKIELVKIIGGKLDLTNMEEQRQVTKEFSIRNASDEAKVYDLDFKEVVNDYGNNLKYSLYKNEELIVDNEVMPSENEKLLENQKIAARTTDEYRLVISYDDAVALSKSKIKLLANEEKRFSANIRITYNDDIEEDSLINMVAVSSFKTGYKELNVLDQTYSVHAYVYDGSQNWNEEKIFGDEADVASEGKYASNMVVVKVNGDLTIGENGSVLPYYDEVYGGPKGFLLYVKGKLTNNGTIDNSHGAYAQGENVYLWKNEDGSYETVPAVGAKGGDAAIARVNNGLNGTKRRTGGGGSGGSTGTSPKSSGRGSDGTSYSGGSGGGGIYCVSGTCAASASGASDEGGAGGASYVSGDGYNAYASAGVGNGPVKDSWSTGRASSNRKPSFSENGTGGLLIVYAESLNNNGKIQANGHNINPTNVGFSRYAGGGASGGGSINIFAKNIVKQGTIEASGGVSPMISGLYGLNGGTGGDGSVSVGNVYGTTYFIKKMDFNYSGEEVEFIAKRDGTYLIETWGAQGGSYNASFMGGYGGYSTAYINLEKGEKLYVNVGGPGISLSSGPNVTNPGGYNGGGDGHTYNAEDRRFCASGGGATSITTTPGILSSHVDENGIPKVDEVIIVSGGGGGSRYLYSDNSTYGAHAGGFKGVTSIGSTNGADKYGGLQTGPNVSGNLGSFGQGANGSYSVDNSPGGGGGFYGGNNSYNQAGGGSSYIGNDRLSIKAMYCYNCEESSDYKTKTISTTGTSEGVDKTACPNGYSTDPISKCAKAGTGYARITYLD